VASWKRPLVSSQEVLQLLPGPFRREAYHHMNVDLPIIKMKRKGLMTYVHREFGTITNIFRSDFDSSQHIEFFILLFS